MNWYVFRNSIGVPSTKGAFTYDVRCFWGIFDLPTYPNQKLYYYLVKSDAAGPTYLPKNLTSYVSKPK